MLLNIDHDDEIVGIESYDLPTYVEQRARQAPGSVVRVWRPALVADLDLDALDDLNRRNARPALRLV